jgi:holo-[acyl-carrier protein] synthase
MADRIIGTGIDIVETARIAHSIEKHGKRFLDRVFLPEEIAYARSNKFPHIHLAARFAAKEAVSKAFGTGIGAKLGWRDIEVRKHAHGEPFLILHGKGEQLAFEMKINKALITLAHTKDYAAANCILIHSS